MHLATNILAAVSAAGAAAACVYYLLGVWAGARFLRARRGSKAGAGFHPPVSILKPLRGVDPEMYECFRSHCGQRYPEYEIVFGVSEREDPAAALVEKLRREFPQRDLRLVVCGEPLGANLKVSKLARMAAEARHAYLVVNDSDIGVGPDYLEKVMAPMADASVGMVTCLYRGEPAKTLGSRLEALGISSDFACGVLIAGELEGISFGLGSTLAFPRAALDAIGGFEPLADYLADDFELGHRIAQAGLRVCLSETVVSSFLPAYDLRGFLAHQLRWARTIRNARPRGYAGLALTFGLPWALLAVLFSSGAGWSWALLGVTAALRAAMALLVGRAVLKDQRAARELWLLPLRDVIALGIWIASFCGDRILWRGTEYILKKGKLRPA
jgi:ceramide glucosyltransferase